MVHGWIQRPHVAVWWHAPTSLADLERDYIIEASSTCAYIAMLEGEPIGFIQSYVAMDSGDGWWEEETDPGARGIDQFLADASKIGQGIGRAMIGAFVQVLFADPAVTVVQTDPSRRRNEAPALSSPPNPSEPSSSPLTNHLNPTGTS